MNSCIHVVKISDAFQRGDAWVVDSDFAVGPCKEVSEAANPPAFEMGKRGRRINKDRGANAGLPLSPRKRHFESTGNQ